MIYPKRLIYSAVVGFILSFLTGLFSGIEFFHILIRAVLCAAVFTGMAALIQFIFDKYLNESIDLEPSGASSGSPRPGSIVDLTIDGEKLQEDSNAPRFKINTNLKSSIDTESLNTGNSGTSINTENSSAAGTVSANNKADSTGFKPMNIAGVAASSSNISDNISNSNNKNSQTDLNVNASSGQTDLSGSEQLTASSSNDIDELPDIGDLDSEGDSSSFGADEDSSGSSGNRSSGSSGKANVAFADGTTPSSKDAALIAQAISSVLAKDE